MSPGAKIVELLVRITNPSSMQSYQLAKFEYLILQGEEVDPDGLTDRIRSAHALGYAEGDGTMIAVGAIKKPTDLYVRNTEAKSGHKNLSRFRGELGYMYVPPAYQRRHLGTRIADALLETFADPVFATTRTDNVGMKAILSKLNFKRVGRKWPSRSHPGKALCLWVRE